MIERRRSLRFACDVRVAHAPQSQLAGLGELIGRVDGGRVGVSADDRSAQWCFALCIVTTARRLGYDQRTGEPTLARGHGATYLKPIRHESRSTGDGFRTGRCLSARSPGLGK